MWFVFIHFKVYGIVGGLGKSLIDERQLASTSRLNAHPSNQGPTCDTAEAPRGSLYLFLGAVEVSVGVEVAILADENSSRYRLT